MYSGRKPLTAGTRLTGAMCEYEIIFPVSEGGSALVYAAKYSKPGGERGALVYIKEIYPWNMSTLERADDGRLKWTKSAGDEDKALLTRYFKALERESELYGYISDRAGRRHLDDLGLDGGDIEGRFSFTFNVIELFESNGTKYMVLETERGETLEQLLSRRPNLAPEEICAIVKSILKAVGAIHEIGVLHLDIKPSNLHLAAQTGVVRLLDFNSAVVEGGTTGFYSRGYSPLEASSPSFILADTQPRRDSDLYAVGAILYRLVFGRRITRQEQIWSSSTCVFSDAPGFCAGIPFDSIKAFQDILIKALSFHNREARYQTAESFANDVDSLCDALIKRVDRISEETLVQAVGELFRYSAYPQAFKAYEKWLINSTDYEKAIGSADQRDVEENLLKLFQYGKIEECYFIGQWLIKAYTSANIPTHRYARIFGVMMCCCKYMGLIQQTALYKRDFSRAMGAAADIGQWVLYQNQANAELENTFDFKTQLDYSRELIDVCMEKRAPFAAIAKRQMGMELEPFGEELMRPYGTAASALAFMGRYDEAIEMFKKSLALCRDEGNRRISLCSLLFAAVFGERDDVFIKYAPEFFNGHLDIDGQWAAIMSLPAHDVGKKFALHLYLSSLKRLPFKSLPESLVEELVSTDYAREFTRLNGDPWDRIFCSLAIFAAKAGDARAQNSFMLQVEQYAQSPSPTFKVLNCGNLLQYAMCLGDDIMASEALDRLRSVLKHSDIPISIKDYFSPALDDFCPPKRALQLFTYRYR